MTPESPIKQGVATSKDRSDLASLYPEAKPINTNPISTPEEIAERKRLAYEKEVRLLRRESFRIGLYIAAPYLLGLIAIQQIVLRIPYLPPDDIGGAMFVVFSAFLTTTLTVFLAYYLFRRTGDVFNNHYLRAWPVITGILVSMMGASSLALRVADYLPLGIFGYVTSLAIIAAVSVVVSVLLIYVWTSKLSQQTKVAILGVLMILFIVLAFL